MYNLFLDDVREANTFLQDTRTWVTVRSYNEFVKIITERGVPSHISFDHDLAWEHYPMNNVKNGSVILDYENYKEKTGYDCAKWIIEFCMKTNQELPTYQVHSMNPVGKRNIELILENYKNKNE